MYNTTHSFIVTGIWLSTLVPDEGAERKRTILSPPHSPSPHVMGDGDMEVSVFDPMKDQSGAYENMLPWRPRSQPDLWPLYFM